MRLFNPNEAAVSVNRLVAGVVAGAVVLATAFMQMLAAFGVMIDAGQQTAVIAFLATLTGVIGPLVGAQKIRANVTPWDPESGAASPVGMAPVGGPGEG